MHSEMVVMQGVSYRKKGCSALTLNVQSFASWWSDCSFSQSGLTRRNPLTLTTLTDQLLTLLLWISFQQWYIGLREKYFDYVLITFINGVFMIDSQEIASHTGIWSWRSSCLHSRGA